MRLVAHAARAARLRAIASMRPDRHEAAGMKHANAKHGLEFGSEHHAPKKWERAVGEVGSSKLSSWQRASSTSGS
jgi:hypothetical protein